jgi:predicted RNA methylase
MPLPDLHVGDALDVLRSVRSESVDAVVTDPPYGLAFMGHAWDGTVPDVTFWSEVLRVAKPGAHVLAFGGSRTYHRLAVAIEDAGFEIRDQLLWVYGSGFPKSHDVAKAIDKTNGEADRLHRFTAWMRTTGVTARDLDALTGTKMGSHYLTAASQPAIPTPALWSAIRPALDVDVPAWIDELVERHEAERQVVGKATGKIVPDPERGPRHTIGGHERTFDVTVAATEEARRWEGWGTALKPSHEPIVMARRPLRGTVAANVTRHGTGAINVEACRIGRGEGGEAPAYTPNHGNQVYGAGMGGGAWANVSGRWPANVIHDGSDEVLRRLSEASRFFYAAKPTRDDRGAGNLHPTVKPTALFRHLVRLVTPPGGVVLDPFAGSGTTGVAAMREGFRSLLVEIDDAYAETIRRRCDLVEATPDDADGGERQASLF